MKPSSGRVWWMAVVVIHCTMHWWFAKKKTYMLYKRCPWKVLLVPCDRRICSAQFRLCEPTCRLFVHTKAVGLKELASRRQLCNDYLLLTFLPSLWQASSRSSMMFATPWPKTAQTFRKHSEWLKKTKWIPLQTLKKAKRKQANW